MYITALVFAFFYPSPSDADRAACAKLIANLGSQRYAVRETAARDLGKVGSAAKSSLQRTIATHRDEETVSRCRAILKAIIAAEVESLCPMPFIDAHWYDVAAKSYQYDEAKHRHYRAHLNAIGADGRPWDNYRGATYAWVEERLAAGASPRAMRMILAGLHARDEVFIGTCPPRDDEENPPVVVDWREYLRGK